VNGADKPTKENLKKKKKIPTYFYEFVYIASWISTEKKVEDQHKSKKPEGKELSSIK